MAVQEPDNARERGTPLCSCRLTDLFRSQTRLSCTMRKKTKLWSIRRLERSDLPTTGSPPAVQTWQQLGPAACLNEGADRA